MARANRKLPVKFVAEPSLGKRLKHTWCLYVLLLPAVIYFFIFSYLPIVGVQIAFRDYTAIKGIWNSDWVGLKHFVRFVNTAQFWPLILNTLKLSVYSLLFQFPFPIVLALVLNEARDGRFKKIIQTLTYAPHFISTVVFVSMIIMFLSPTTGIINKIMEALGGTAQDFMGNADAFRAIYVISGIWQNSGWSAIIFVAALSGVDQELYEAARIDGANRLQKIWHIDIPCILPTIVILFIMNCGKVLSVGYEKVFLMQNSLNQSVSEIISTYVYKVGLINAQYSYTAAIGLFNSVVNLALLIVVNRISKKVSEISLF